MVADNVESGALYRLMAWLSPSYPVGAFSYSSGIEWAVEAGDITDAESLRRWLAVVIGEGGGFCDAVFFVHAHRSLADSNDAALRAVAELAAAFAPSKERHLETTAQGAAFIEATRAAWSCSALGRLASAWNGPVAYPVAVGVDRCGSRHRACSRAACLPSCGHRKSDFGRRAARSAWPERRPAGAGGAGARGRGDGSAGARYAA